MSFDYTIHEIAHEEYIKAFEWYEERSDGLGVRFMQAVEKRIEFISQNPRYNSKRDRNYREGKVDDFPCMIVYEFFPNRKFIHISAIYHSKRNPKGKFRREKR